ncbi:MAG: PEP-CTERM sorting domain-containing protein, partial [Planctomycetota bacterium]
LDLDTGAASAISSSATTIGDAIDLASGNPSGTSSPFLISLGGVGNTLYGVDLDSDSLISLDPETGDASVVGAVGAVGSVTNGSASYSGFSALTGVDEDEDGQYDALFGSVNFIRAGDDLFRLGGVARYDLTDGTWQLVGTNPGVIFFGFGAAAVPEPSTFSLLAIATVGLCVRSRRSRR